jgi:hypothetical protein
LLFDAMCFFFQVRFHELIEREACVSNAIERAHQTIFAGSIKELPLVEYNPVFTCKSFVLIELFGPSLVRHDLKFPENRYRPILTVSLDPCIGI